MAASFLRGCVTSCTKFSRRRILLPALFSQAHLPHANKHTDDSYTINSRVTLSDGHTMPIFGLGSFAMDGDASYEAVVEALNQGYRLVDTAQWYQNEHTVGKAIAQAHLPRNEYFVVTKLNPENHGYESAKLKLAASLEMLGLDFVDLYLIHSPHGGLNIETWKAFMELKGEGLTKSIGVSNYNIHHVEALRDAGLDIPTVNQFELHPWNQYPSTVEYCRNNDITVMGYCPLARCRYFGTPKGVLIDELGEKYSKTRAQILLRWSLQSGFITIPKSANSERIKENAGIFGWNISDEDMHLMEGLDEQGYVGTWNAHKLAELADFPLH